MVFGSMIIDIVCIVFSVNKGGRFALLTIPLVELLIKIGIVCVCAYEYFKNRQERERLSDGEKQRRMQNH
jgi:hypothetical protein